jgi:hypothetical protein
VLNGANFIGVVDDRVTIRFPRKWCLLFQQPAQSGRGIEEPKGGSLNDFEIRGVPRKEPPHNGQKAINPFSTVICPKKKGMFWHKRSIVLSTTMSDQHLSKFII